MQQRAGGAAMAFMRSLFVLAGLIVVVPWALMRAADARFGGRTPWHGVAAPSDWEADRIRTALTDRLTDDTVADIVIRLSLAVAWVAVVVLVSTIAAEVVHMLRHDRLPMPDVRGLGLSQPLARIVAAGLLVVVPLVSSPSKSVAGGARAPALGAGPVATIVEHTPPPVVDGDAAPRHDLVDEASPEADRPVVAESPGTYLVRTGDSIYGIAERLVGPDPAAVSSYAEQLLELNLGNRMADGQHFTNAAYIDVGWVLQLPGSGSVAGEPDRASPQHVVERGESLWAIADDELGDARRWPEIYDANVGRTFDDGRVLDDPDLIQPGWDLDLPVDPPIEADALADGAVDTPPAAESNSGSTGESIVEPAAGEAPGEAAPTGSDDREIGAEAGAEPAARPDNVWMPKSAGETVAAADLVPTDAGSTDDEVRAPDPAASPRLLTFGRAAMLSAGVLTLLAVRRRNHLRQAPPRSRMALPDPMHASTERTLRSIDSGERFRRVELAVRAAARPLVDVGARVLAVSVSVDGEIELRSSAPATLPAPWSGAGDRWQLAPSTPIELLMEAADGVTMPCPALVQIGRDLDERDVYIDLEATEAIEVGGPGDQADAVVAAVAATLAGSTLAEVTTLIGAGVPDEAFLGHRRHEPVRDAQRAFEAAAEALGSTASQRVSTFELRTRATSGEAWEPAVVLLGAALNSISPPSARTGLAVVSASPIHGPSSRLAPDGDAWELKPAGIRLVPVGLSTADVAAIAAVVDVPAPVMVPGSVVVFDDDLTMAPPLDDAGFAAVGADDVVDEVVTDEVAGQLAATPSPQADETPVPEWSLQVRLLGPIDVVDADGEPVTFERSKTRELVAWLATHRERSTRTAARTALWELDVRDATFANVVSEARRALARLVEPPPGDEWVGRTMTDDLPLHELVRTDADLLEHALEVAALQPPAQAIATLTPAVELITGLPFEGTSYLWPDAEGLTSQLVLLATSAATELAAHCLSLGDIDGVFAATGRGLRVLPGHEELIGLRMQAYARAGDHAGVRHEWESYERVINADPWSDGEPSPKLVDLRRELLNPSR